MRLWDLYEDIPRPPRNLALFFKNRQKELQSLKELLVKAESMKLDWAAVKDTGSTARQMEEELGETVENLEYFIQRKDLTRVIDDFSSSIGYSYNLLGGEYKDDPMRGDRLRHNLERDVGWIDSIEERFGQNLDSYIKAAGMVDELREQLREDGYFDERYADEEEIQNFETVLKGLEVAGVVAQSLKKIIAMKQKIEDVANWRAAHSYGNKPKPKDIEVMYHTTAFADEIVQQGFQAEKPSREERYGLGAYGDFQNISFTHDLHTARVIQRSMKELVMIANGQLRKNQILRWMQDEGINLKDVAFNLPSHPRAQPTKDDFGFQKWPSWQDILTKMPDEPEYTAKLFHAWLYLNKIGRENPVFANIEVAVRALKGRNPDDVGILQSRIQMDDPSIDYQPAEREWRVPPSAVLSVERVQ